MKVNIDMKMPFEEVKELIDAYEAEHGDDDFSSMVLIAEISKEGETDKVSVFIDRQEGTYQMVAEDADQILDVLSMADFADDITAELLEYTMMEDIIGEYFSEQESEIKKNGNTVLLVLGTDESIQHFPYNGYESMSNAVNGYIEHCGYPKFNGVEHEQISLYCNEEFLLIDNSDFKKVNALASILSQQPIYGPAFLAVDKDSPDGIESAGFEPGSRLLNTIEDELNFIKSIHEPTIKSIHEKMDGKRPEPHMEFISFDTPKERFDPER